MQPATTEEVESGLDLEIFHDLTRTNSMVDPEKFIFDPGKIS